MNAKEKKKKEMVYSLGGADAVKRYTQYPKKRQVSCKWSEPRHNSGGMHGVQARTAQLRVLCHKQAEEPEWECQFCMADFTLTQAMWSLSYLITWLLIHILKALQRQDKTANGAAEFNLFFCPPQSYDMLADITPAF